ncbi:MAG: KpsF/GutQ family sugar-phosphate isomerase [Limnobacter sp.]|jgi:arabinose-5-phosphate isomerase|uniref:KpsF/GutQ family sugar-phosphate isomerase n=1 Tax=Limnobacter sp. TaxID=2003368 RepID=UPI000DB40EB6|nr:KpsF/GutQ family sugar-phosphate isomerase [Limnobacter sp.]MDZ4048753.1 KpsF/GutQ family sugar-phosphate isomerase [Limnobacter sp.]PZO15237.1 MAG: KpsF/GutQ family sugar-phosphate isomerase [Betaproteobacteria bacterium]PZO25160.1 MAG: KpsF/GutQ family sugar-phosphate isomerase [Betaproteobacteria bacterium]RZO90683.1 MAG: KpsF/GutQ family sugar-phosphate isomerase [Limnobacter sp.]
MSKTPSNNDKHDFLAMAREALAIEAQAVLALSERLNDQFSQATAAILNCKGRVILVGVGKSGLIAKKIAATFASTGTPSFFVHATEASHGDLGMITQEDVVIALSNSGNTEELVAVLPAIARRGAKIVAMTGKLDSALARQADLVLDCGVEKEACPLNLAPTASTTAALALGDALAVVVLKARGFSEEDFALSHPGGSLGRKLLTHVSDVMRKGDRIPTVAPSASISNAILEITKKGLGMTAVVGANNKLLGVFTDGDLRRLIEQGLDLRGLLVSEVMNSAPKCISPDKLAVEAVRMMEVSHISQVVVTDEQGHIVGALNFHDLFEAKVV